MTKLKSYRDLEVWKKSIELAEMVYRISARFPSEEKFGLTSQVRRAAVSVPANIAEGAGTSRNRGVSPVLGDSQRLVGRDRDLSDLAQRLGLTTSEQTKPLMSRASEVGRMLNGLKRSLRSKS